MTTEIEFTFDEAVRTLGVTPDKLTRLIEEGKIQSTLEGGRTRISRRAILDYMAAVSAVPAIERSKRR
jgi:excisionase family DNA binding protein